MQGIVFFQSQDSIAEQWEEHTDEKTKKKYWYNKITKTVRSTVGASLAREPTACSDTFEVRGNYCSLPASPANDTSSTGVT